MPHKLQGSTALQGLVAANGIEGGVTANGVSLPLGQGRWGAPALLLSGLGGHILFRVENIPDALVQSWCQQCICPPGDTGAPAGEPGSGGAGPGPRPLQHGAAQSHTDSCRLTVSGEQRRRESPSPSPRSSGLDPHAKGPSAPSSLPVPGVGKRGGLRPRPAG